MTDKEIEAIAREYVADVYNGDTDFQPEAECLINWLSDRYEIVAKDKIKAEHSKALVWSDNARSYIEGRANMRLLKSLFPQTLKQE